MAIITQFPTKSGRRKLLLSQEHGQMKYEDLDMDRILEFNNGTVKFFHKLIFPLVYTFLSTKLTKFLARNHHGGPLRVRIHFGSKDELRNFVEVTFFSKSIPKILTKFLPIYVSGNHRSLLGCLKSRWQRFWKFHYDRRRSLLLQEHLRQTWQLKKLLPCSTNRFFSRICQ